MYSCTVAIIVCMYVQWGYGDLDQGYLSNYIQTNKQCIALAPVSSPIYHAYNVDEEYQIQFVWIPSALLVLRNISLWSISIHHM